MDTSKDSSVYIALFHYKQININCHDFPEIVAASLYRIVKDQTHSYMLLHNDVIILNRVKDKHRRNEEVIEMNKRLLCCFYFWGWEFANNVFIPLQHRDCKQSITNYNNFASFIIQRPYMKKCYIVHFPPCQPPPPSENGYIYSASPSKKWLYSSFFPTESWLYSELSTLL